MIVSTFYFSTWHRMGETTIVRNLPFTKTPLSPGPSRIDFAI